MKRYALALFAPIFFATIGCDESDEAPETPGESGDETSGDTEHALGDSPTPECDAAVFALEQFRLEIQLPTPDRDVLTELYVGTEDTPSELQLIVQQADIAFGRTEAGVLIDDAIVLEALVNDDKLSLIDAEAAVTAAIAGYVRELVLEVSEAQPDITRDPALLYYTWDFAYCLWDGALRPLTQAADAIEPTEARWEQDMADAFEWGNSGIEGPEVNWAIDEFIVRPAKQIAEKSLLAVAERLLIDRVTQAQSSADPIIAHEALAAFRLVEDKIADLNTPGVAIITDMLLGDPAAIDPAVIRREVNIAFAKRARKYCDEAVVYEYIGTSEAVKGVYEGIIYSQVVLPGMEETLDGFDGDAYMQEWQDYLVAITNEDFAQAIAISESLVEQNCAYQTALGIAECTSTIDEPA